MLYIRGITAGICLLLATTLSAQDNAPTLESLWKTGSLWQVGENKQKVADARAAIIASGDAGLDFAIGKLAAGGTLEIRCLRAVIGGFGQKAVPQLTNNIRHEDKSARRNVADLLSQLDARDTAPKLLGAVAVEESGSVKLAQLSALAKWQVEDALPHISELSQDPLDRIRHRTTGLLKAFDSDAAARRLMAMLEDDVFYVRDGARNALRSTPTGTSMCVDRVKTELKKPSDDQAIPQLRRWLSVASSSAAFSAEVEIIDALKHGSAQVRAEVAKGLSDNSKKFGSLADSKSLKKRLAVALDSENDPFAKSELQKALGEFAKQEG
ncbi:MAG: HEAT repeat domain-containing protein [Planctomycetota bacterium]|jgi:hypothetical protein